MKASNYLAKLPQEAAIKNIQAFRDYDLITLDVGSPLFSGASPSFPGVSFNSTSFSQRTACFSGVTQKLMLFPVYTRLFRSSPHSSGVSTANTGFFLQLHQINLELF